MAKILLIHGYGTGNPEVKKDNKKYYQFLGFRTQIDNKEAVVFEWFSGADYKGFLFFNPIHHFMIYKKEKQLAQNMQTLQKMQKTLNKENPQIIICHSMGAFLLLNYLKDHALTKSVKKIIFIQADVPAKFEIPEKVEIKLRDKSLIWEDYYCPWDFALIASLLINFYLPAGLFGAFGNNVKNHFYPLYSYILLHISSIRSEKFVKKLLNTT